MPDDATDDKDRVPSLGTRPTSIYHAADVIPRAGKGVAKENRRDD
jgi:hypothetical protein